MHTLQKGRNMVSLYSVDGYFGGSCANCYDNNEGVPCSLCKLFSDLFWVIYNELLIYGPVGGSASLSSVTAAINAAAAADPNEPAMATAPETPAAPRDIRSRRGIAPINLSPTLRSVVSGRVLSRPPVTPTPAARNLRQRVQNTIHSKFLPLFDIRN